MLMKLEVALEKAFFHGNLDLKMTLPKLRGVLPEEEAEKHLLASSYSCDSLMPLPGPGTASALLYQ